MSLWIAGGSCLNEDSAPLGLGWPEILQFSPSQVTAPAGLWPHSEQQGGRRHLGIKGGRVTEVAGERDWDKDGAWAYSGLSKWPHWQLEHRCMCQSWVAWIHYRAVHLKGFYIKIWIHAKQVSQRSLTTKQWSRTLALKPDPDPWGWIPLCHVLAMTPSFPTSLFFGFLFWDVVLTAPTACLCFVKCIEHCQAQHIISLMGKRTGNWP